METVAVHPRVHERHPEIQAEDVWHAWRHQVASVVRESFTGNRYVCVGIDGHGRALEMVAAALDGSWVVFHAMTPPTRNVMREVGIDWRERGWST